VAVAIDNASLDGAVRRIGDRWSLRLIGALLAGDRTFNELGAEVGGIAPNILAARLRALQRDALVAARPYQQRPVRMRYTLTADGRRLGDAVALLAEWGARGTDEAERPRHEACGTALELRPWCPTCEVAVDPTASADVIWA
jgi:DNA-binding HxlR family transcriptional regulator